MTWLFYFGKIVCTALFAVIFYGYIFYTIETMGRDYVKSVFFELTGIYFYVLLRIQLYGSLERPALESA